MIKLFFFYKAHLGVIWGIGLFFGAILLAGKIYDKVQLAKFEKNRIKQAELRVEKLKEKRKQEACN